MATYPALDRFDFDVALLVATHEDGVVSSDGDVERVLPWKSTTKLLTATATLVAVEAGHLTLDESAGPEGSTVRHLLAHASGLPMDAGGPSQAPGKRRVYSNLGFETLGELVGSRVGAPINEWVRAQVVEPLGLTSVVTEGSCAHGYSGSTADLLTYGFELLDPALISAELHAEATATVFPGLSGVLPGFGRQAHNDWGLGFEVRSDKDPHWTGPGVAPTTFGHFGQSGSFLWADPTRGAAAAFLGAKRFDTEVHGVIWPELNEQVVAALDAR
ncbi:serine hydrolase domain-containing protein [Georgenia sp. Z1491]|uniref:serine hydrolase domain-containing protein n=1 Tax=Georgenia sp. Z1491 TaxID=3416707 RepID=UPI003CE8D5E7